MYKHLTKTTLTHAQKFWNLHIMRLNLEASGGIQPKHLLKSKFSPIWKLDC